jgi:geranylgeranyl reductase family protein
MKQDYDVVVSGAGPAGTSASLFLTKAGIRHLLIDKAVFPRDKVCGDALSGKVFSHIKHIDPQFSDACFADAEKYIPCHGVRFIAPNGKALDIPFAPGLKNVEKAPGYVSKRIDFDYKMMTMAKDSVYATVWEGAELSEIERVEGGLKLYIKRGGKTETIYTPLLIGAEGERACSAKFVKGTAARNLDEFCAGIRSYYTGVTGFHEKNFIELHFLPELLPGYFWIFPLPNGGANVGAGMLSSAVSDKKFNLRAAMNKLIHEHPVIAPRFKNAIAQGPIQGWGLPLGKRVGKVTSDSILLAGDAASLIDPFTGEGIGNAILSGRYAAQTAVEAIAKQDFSEAFFEQYPQLLQQKIGQELALSATMLKLSKQQWLFNMVANKAARSKELRDTFSCMFADIDLRSKFRNPLFYLKILFA